MHCWLCTAWSDAAGTHSYFYNKATEESSYEVPPGFYDTPAAKWVVMIDTDSGTPYYVDQGTGDAVWEEPAALASLGQGAALQGGASPAAKARPRPPPAPPPGPPPSGAVLRKRRVSIVSAAPAAPQRSDSTEEQALGAASSGPSAGPLPPHDAAASVPVVQRPARSPRTTSVKRRQTLFKKRSGRRMSTTAAPAPVKIEGMLLKKSKKGAWQPRYFWTNSHYLLYASKKGGKTLGGVDLGGAGSSVQRCEFSQKEGISLGLGLAPLAAMGFSCVALLLRAYMSTQCLHTRRRDCLPVHAVSV
jgi:hypothetical protein